MAGAQFTPNAGDQIIDPQTGEFTEIGRRLVRLLSTAVGALAPIDAQYWTSTSAASLTNERNLGALASGYLLVVTLGAIAVPATVATIPLADITGLVAALAARRTFVPRVTGAASSATPTPNADVTDLYSLTAQAAAAAFGTPTGTPVNGQPLQIRIKDNATAHALTWSAGYVAGGVALPATTVLSKILTLSFLYNTDNGLNAWQLIAAAQEV